MHKDYDKIKAEYIQISSDTRNKLTVLSATLIAAIYALSNATNQRALRWALLFYVLTIFGEVVASYLKSQHYSLWFDGQIDNIDFRQSWWGKAAEISFWLPIITFVVGSVLFFWSILK